MPTEHYIKVKQARDLQETEDLTHTRSTKNFKNQFKFPTCKLTPLRAS